MSNTFHLLFFFESSIMEIQQLQHSQIHFAQNERRNNEDLHNNFISFKVI